MAAVQREKNQADTGQEPKLMFTSNVRMFSDSARGRAVGARRPALNISETADHLGISTHSSVYSLHRKTFSEWHLCGWKC